jgi:glycerol-3-phosphate acyltransferase PlsY
VELVSYVVIAVAGYLLGSIPTGFLVAQAKGIDIRAVGSGNIGATNVLRALGKPAGAFVLFMDALKGWLAVVPLSQLILLAFGLGSDVRTREIGAIIGGVSVILGHNFTCWLHFKGGKGIATSAGVLLALVPWALLTILIVWIVVFASTRYVSLASVAAAAALPFASWATHESLTRVMVSGALGALAIYKHKSNIQRLLHGTEPRFGSKSRENAS